VENILIQVSYEEILKISEYFELIIY